MPINNELKMPVFHIDDQPVEFHPGEKILSAALRNGEKYLITVTTRECRLWPPAECA
ncbi:MAG: hypothetical protein CM1200mP28_07390 [Deltaproteobacteria bacterium]|nr:MAG: hypothetical protein CM1200mP28_07390 [Deltaproteobacteria bacterium]